MYISNDEITEDKMKASNKLWYEMQSFAIKSLLFQLSVNIQNMESILNLENTTIVCLHKTPYG